MKKYIGIKMIIVCLSLLTSCSSNKEIVFMKIDDLKEIEILNNDYKNVVKISDKEKMSQLIDKLKNNSKFTDIESVNDEPLNINEYIIIDFYYKDNKNNLSRFYLYNKKGKSYIEKPYEGIWRLKNEVFNIIKDRVNN